MKSNRLNVNRRAFAIACVAAPAFLPLLPARAEGDIVPNLDVPFVPTPMAVVDAMLDLAQVKREDMLYDLGCGDGRIVLRAARRFGCRGVGVDLDPRRIEEARNNARRAGKKIEALVRFEQGDVFKFDFSPATVVTMYLLPSVNLRLRPRLLAELQPGTRVVSHDFDMGDWPAEQRITVENSYVYRWTVPKRAA